MTIDLIEALVYSIVYESMDERIIKRQMQLIKKRTGLSYKKINKMISSEIDRTCWSYKCDNGSYYGLPFDEMNGIGFHEVGKFIDDTTCRSIEHQRRIIAYNNR